MHKIHSVTIYKSKSWPEEEMQKSKFYIFTLKRRIICTEHTTMKINSGFFDPNALCSRYLLRHADFDADGDLTDWLQ